MGTDGKMRSASSFVRHTFADSTLLGIAARLAVPESCLCAPISTALTVNGQGVAVSH